MTRGRPPTALTGWAALALIDGRMLPARPCGPWRDRYLAETVEKEQGAGAIERTMLAVGSRAEGAPDCFGGRDLMAALGIGATNGSVVGQTNLTYVLRSWRLRAAQIARAPPSLARATAGRDGGFNFDTRGGQSDVDDTGAVLQCARRHRTHERTISRAARFIRGQQNRDGGFGDAQGGELERSIDRVRHLRADRRRCVPAESSTVAAHRSPVGISQSR